MIKRYKYRGITVLFFSMIMFGGCFSNRCSVGSIEGGCAVVEADNSSLLNIDSSFFYFAQNIPILDSNFTLSSDEDFTHLDVKSKFIPEGAALLGRLKPFSNYEFILYSYPADIRLPILEVYNFKGEKVNERFLYDFEYCSNENPEQSHEVELSADHSTIYRSTFCAFAFSAFGYDSIVVRDLIAH